MTLLEQAQEFLTRVSALGRDAARTMWGAVDPEVRDEASRIRKEGFFIEENRLPEKRQVHESPDGSYILTVDHYTTEEGCWNYTRGRVSHFNGDNPIADVMRNYGGFPVSWVEAPDGNMYLYCGADYQGQTFIDLGSGKRVDSLPEDASKGWGFCWVVHHPGPKGSPYFAVEGCFWGAPYEVWVFDISDPMAPKRIWRGEGDFGGWESGDSCKVVGLCYEAVNLPGHPLHGKSENDMSLEELGVADAEAQERGFEEESEYWVDVQDQILTLSFPRDIQLPKSSGEES